VQVVVIGSSRNETYTFETESGPEDVIEITLTPNAEANISLNKTTWSPTCDLGNSQATSLAMFNLDNAGSIQVDVVVSATNTTDWTLDTTPNHDQFNMSFNHGSGWTLLDVTSGTFKSNLAYDASVDFGLQVFMPTSSSTNTSQESIVTFVATVD
jgi:hypothetical protein